MYNHLQKVVRAASQAQLLGRRAVSSTSSRSRQWEAAAEREPVREVFISQSSDTFTNLALEDWLSQHHDFEHKHLLLLWRNNNGVSSQFGSSSEEDQSAAPPMPYQIEGNNVNCTFFTKWRVYQRRRNLDVVYAAIQRLTSHEVSFNKCEDIVFSNKYNKITGDPHSSFHSNWLPEATKQSGDSQSVSVPVHSLRKFDPSLNLDRFQSAVGYEFLRRTLNGHDGGMEAANRQRGFQLVRPDDYWFPGLAKLREDLVKQTSKVCGNALRFTVKGSFPLPPTLLTSGEPPVVDMELDVENGVVRGARDLPSVMYGMPFGSDLTAKVVHSLQKAKVNPSRARFLSDCVVELVERQQK